MAMGGRGEEGGNHVSTPGFPGQPGRPQDRDEGPCPGVRAGERGEAGSGRRRGKLPTTPVPPRSPPVLLRHHQYPASTLDYRDEIYLGGFSDSCQPTRARKSSLIVPSGLPITARVTGDALTVLHTVISDWDV